MYEVFFLFIFFLYEQKVKRPLSALKLSTSFRIAVQPSVERAAAAVAVEQPFGLQRFWAVTKTLMSPCARRILQLAKSHQSAGHL